MTLSGSISIHLLSTIGLILEDEQVVEGLLVFCFSFWTARKSKYIGFQRKISELHLRGLLFVVLLLFVDQIRDQPIQSMRNSDPRARIVFVQRFNSYLHSTFTLQVTGGVSNFGNDTHIFGWDSFTKSIAEAQRTQGKHFTTRSIVKKKKTLYWCRIIENSWSRTTLHDKRHWRVRTICRASDMSWVHFATR